MSSRVIEASPSSRKGLAGIVGFPAQVNDVAARTVATGVFLTAVVTVATGQAWLAPLLAYGFVARTLSGPRFSLLGQLATRVVAPRLPAYAKTVPGPPKRFAQAIGASFTLAATGLWLAGDNVPALVLLGVLALPAFLEAALGYCVGCKVFALLMRAGVIPESTCAECADLWGKKAAARREAQDATSRSPAAS
ncbi:MAG: hypothetical protein JWO62_1751 [Acidimicrobiaceae bacterium]|nr:hypothetical protein [Acidimicrobiaceae bacterium]